MGLVWHHGGALGSGVLIGAGWAVSNRPDASKASKLARALVVQDGRVAGVGQLLAVGPGVLISKGKNPESRHFRHK
jgi:hypothetical protein